MGAKNRLQKIGNFVIQKKKRLLFLIENCKQKKHGPDNKKNIFFKVLDPKKSGPPDTLDIRAQIDWATMSLIDRLLDFNTTIAH